MLGKGAMNEEMIKRLLYDPIVGKLMAAAVGVLVALDCKEGNPAQLPHRDPPQLCLPLREKRM